MRRSTGIVLAVFAALAVLALLSYGAFPGTEKNIGPKLRLAGADAEARAARIVLSRSGSAFDIRLEKEGDRWFLALGDGSYYPARDARVRLFLKELSAPRGFQKMRSNDGSRYGLSGTDAVAVRIEETDGAILADFAFGAVSAGGDRRWVRTGANGEILETAETFAPWLDASAASWVELSIFGELLETSDIQGVVYAAGGIERSLLRGKDPEVERLSAELAGFRCLDITNIPRQPEETVTLVMGNAETETFTLSSLDGNTAILRFPRSGAAYVIGKPAGDRIAGALGIR